MLAAEEGAGDDVTGTGQPPEPTACDREPIRIPGSIQPHGALLVAGPEGGTILQAAGDTTRLLGAEVGALLGRPVAEVLGIDPRAEIRRLPPAARGEATHLGSTVPSAGGVALDLLAHERGGLLVLELEPAPRDRPAAARMLAAIRAASAALAAARDLRRLGDAAARQVRVLTGFDRVMVYRFLEDGSGEVVAEDKARGLPAYLNHRYPASDIPRQARELYLRNRVRLIPDVGYAPAPLVPALCPATGRPLDMSDCALRSVSPVHVQYLKNMGVAASMSVSIVRDGALWGLIACHHGAPKAVPYELREACKHMGQILSQQVAAREEADAHAEGLRLRAAHDELVAALAASPSVEDALAERLAELRAAIPSGGAALVRGDGIAAAGRTPDAGQVRDLAGWLLARGPPDPYATDRLSEQHAPAGAYRAAASGLLATVVSRADRWLLLWFRAELVETIGWAGDPRKAVEAGAELGTLNPRRSFALWRETVHGRSRPWTGAELAAAGRLGRAVAELRQRQRVRELNGQLRRSLAEQEALVAQKDLLMREVNHRVQNSLQLVGSLLRLQAGAAGDPAVRAQFGEAVRRLTAVAMVHRQLWRSDQIRQVSLDSYLRELREGLVQSWGAEWDEHVRVRAAVPVPVPTETAVALALVITELVTNAVKHAYGGGTGPIEIEVGEEGRGTLRVSVADRGRGAGGSTGRAEGFGSRLVGMLVGQLGGTLERIDNQPGTRVVIRIDIERER